MFFCIINFFILFFFFFFYDCSGCEWESFVYLAEHSPEVLEHTCNIILEIHVAISLQMKTAKQLQLMAKFWHYYLDVFGFKLYYIHANPGIYIIPQYSILHYHFIILLFIKFFIFIQVLISFF